MSDIKIGKNSKIHWCKCKKCHKGFSTIYCYDDMCPQCKQDMQGYKPVQFGSGYGVQFLCSNCDFPKNDTLTFDMKYCWNCGCKLDWSEWEENKK